METKSIYCTASEVIIRSEVDPLNVPVDTVGSRTIRSACDQNPF